MRELSRLTEIDLDAYRAEHVRERIRRAVERERVADERALVSRLRADPDARARFRRSIAVSVSGLFRDPAQFELLEHVLLPPLIASGRRLTVWSAGCANGSELYSVAMLLDRLGGLDNAFLLGSDLLAENIAEARTGTYGDVVVPPQIRARVRWERRDLVREPPPATKWKLILCRNVAIYLSPPERTRLHEALAGALAPGGVLLLGRSERVRDARALALEPVAKNAYRKAG